MAKRQYGTGSVTWISMTKARLRIRVGGVRRSKVMTFPHRDRGGRGQASDALADFIAEVEAEANAAPPRTLGEAVDAYIAHCERLDRAKGTIESYQAIARRRLTPGLKAVQLAELGPYELGVFYGEMKDRGYGPSSIRQTHVLISATLEQAVTWGWVETSAAERAKPSARVASKSPRLSPQDVWALIRAAQAPVDAGGDADPVLAVALFLLVVTGARRGELCGLKWSDVDVERSSINIARQYLPGGGGLYVAPLKSETGAEDGARTVHVGRPTISLLERYSQLQRAVTDREPDGWLISYDGGTTPMNPKTLAALISSLAKRSGFDGVTTHTFRKVTATQLIASGADVDSAARRMGHTTQVMFGTYVKGADDRAVAAAEALEARLIDQGLPIGELLAGPDS